MKYTDDLYTILVIDTNERQKNKFNTESIYDEIVYESLEEAQLAIDDLQEENPNIKFEAITLLEMLVRYKTALIFSEVVSFKNEIEKSSITS